MTTESRKRAGTAGPAGSGGDAFLERLGDRISSQHDLPAPPAKGFGGPPKSNGSDVHMLPGGPLASEEDDALEFPPMAPHEPADAFAEFEEMTGEATRIDDSHLLAEQSTAILEEAPRQPFLAVERGNDQGREFVLQEGENGVGRGIDNDVILADVAVSRRHMRILRSGNQLVLKDLGSGNGTLVNGKRHAQVPLVDGDRLELGETVLVVRIPGTELRADTHDTTDEANVAGSLPPPPPTPNPMAPGYQPELTPRATSTQHLDRAPRVKGAIVLPKPIFLAILLGGALLIAMLAAAMAILVIKGTSDDEPTAAAEASGPFAHGVSAYEARRWDDAERGFREALQESPSDPRANTYLQRIQQARADEALVTQARTSLAAGNVNDALTAIGGVPADSPFAGEATDLRRQAIAARVAEHTQAGQRALSANNIAEANRCLQSARAVDPTSPRVAELAAAIAARGGAPPPVPPVAPVPPPPPVVDELPSVLEPAEPAGATASPERGGRTPRERPRPTTGGTNPVPAIITDYLAGRFDQASRAARAAAGRASGSERTNLNQLADRIARFSELYRRIQAANFGPSVRAQMETAIQLDRQIARNQQYSNRMRSAVVASHLADARRTRGQQQQSCNSVRQALAVDSGNAEARAMGVQCENFARGMLREAASAPAARAEGIYRQVLLMVPRGSPLASEASSRLEAARRGRVNDEDE
ncbi:MAG: FHA domain-containing protein [Sandaracinaceae bacterium]|nr:FHA domain-containing protein [Sandaracinaceae bacterium]